MTHKFSSATVSSQITEFIESAVQTLERRQDSRYAIGYAQGLVSAFFVAGAISGADLSEYFSRLDALEAKAGA